MLRKLYLRLSPKGRLMVRRIYYLPHDVICRLFKKYDSLVPPKGMTFVGSGNFVLIGNKFFYHIVETTNISDSEKILDIGCGIGRIARPFSGFLSSNGEYQGFDIIDYGINWCKRNYRKYNNFKFDCFPLKNDLYNLESGAKAEDFEFPYDKNKFGLVILISVFTHMQKEEVVNYFRQISRVLKPGGYCYVSFFLLNRGEKSEFFCYDFGEYHLHDIKVKNANVAYDTDFVTETAKKAGLSLQNKFDGWWKTGHKLESVDFQDIIIFKKE
jgi:SAM-dependent methyltransferase